MDRHQGSTIMKTKNFSIVLDQQEDIPEFQKIMQRQTQLLKAVDRFMYEWYDLCKASEIELPKLIRLHKNFMSEIALKIFREPGTLQGDIETFESCEKQPGITMEEYIQKIMKAEEEDQPSKKTFLN